MKRKTILVINAIVLVLFGFPSLFTPEALAAGYGVTLDPVAKHNIQNLGALYLGLAVLSWMARKITDAYALRAISLAFFISYGITMIIGIIDLSALESFNAPGWLSIALYLLLLLGFGYYLFVKPSAS
jgi:hypothetical protein